LLLLKASVPTLLLTATAGATEATEATASALTVAILRLTAIAAILRVAVSAVRTALAIVVVHRATQCLAAPTATLLTAAALPVLPLGTVLLVAASTALPAPATTEVAASATPVPLAAWLLRRLAGWRWCSVTAGLWWGRKIRLFREIRFVVHYFLRYGGQFAKIMRRGATPKFGWVSKIRPARQKPVRNHTRAGIK